MDDVGLSETEVFRALHDRLNGDARYDSGRILSSMCSEPLDIAKKVYILALEKNLGDKSLFPGSAKIERETIAMLGKLLSNPDAAGHIVSGGTEANIMALWVARHLDRKGRREVVLPESAHFSFDTAADLLGLTLVKIPLGDDFSVDPVHISRAVGQNTLAIVGLAGSTGLGKVDPILELSEIAIENDLYLHVDASFGGFVLPFLKDLGLYQGVFDFQARGVKSISIDPHKMGLCPIPAGGILFRDRYLLSTIGRSVPYIGKGQIRFTTLSGSRPGAPVIAVWAAMKRLGRTGYREIVRRCVMNTKSLAANLGEVEGIHLVSRPTMNILGFTCPWLDNRMVVEALSDRGWFLSSFPSHIRVVVMPHTDASHLEAFVSDLKEVLTHLR